MRISIISARRAPIFRPSCTPTPRIASTILPEGRNTLQGAWLIGVQLGYRAQDLVLAFLSAWHDRKHVLTYVGVEAYTLNIEVDYSAGNRDLVAHEFRVEDGLVTHEIAFRTGKTLRVTCRDVIPATDVLS